MSALSFDGYLLTMVSALYPKNSTIASVSPTIFEAGRGSTRIPHCGLRSCICFVYSFVLPMLVAYVVFTVVIVLYSSLTAGKHVSMK